MVRSRVEGQLSMHDHVRLGREILAEGTTMDKETLVRLKDGDGFAAEVRS